jgi:Ca-activated chloride channel homolog
MASRHKFLIVLPLVLLVFIPAVTSSQNKAPDQTTHDHIMMMVTVGNRSGLVKGLKREAFTVIDEKIVRPIEFFEDEDSAISVGILVDHSGSMRTGVTRISEGLTKLFLLGNQNNEYFLMSFSNATKLVMDWSFGRDIVSRKIEITEGKGDTRFYDSTIEALEKFRTAMYSKRVLIVIGDGVDTRSKRSFKELRDLLRNSDITLYVVGILDIIADSGLGVAAQTILDELSFTTGGMSFYPKNRKEIDNAFLQIADELHHRYRIGFRRDSNDPPGKWRHLKIKVNAPDAPGSGKLWVRTREGYSR